ncbi:MAG: DUF1127 domain-containing protein [Arenicellales bacterium]
MNTQTTYSDYTGTSTIGRGVVTATRRAVRSALKSMLTSYWERHAVRELDSLPDYVLNDIGVTRGSIRGVAAAYAKDKADAWARRAESSNGFGG